MKPDVSVVMPVRDGGRLLAGAARSILTQSLKSLELIVVDDHSTDGAPRALDRNDPRLRVISHSGRGVSAAFNAGLQRAQGHYIARMDADDIALPKRLRAQSQFLDTRPELDLCGACVEIFAEEDGRERPPAAGNQRYQHWLNGCRSVEAIRRELFIESPIPNPTAFFRREALVALGGYGDPDWPEDYDLFLRADAMGMRMAKPEGVLLRWRDHDRRLTRRSARYSLERFQAAKAHYLARDRLANRGPVVIWGAGPSGCMLHDLLSAEGVAVQGFLDVHPRRIGGHKRDLPVWPIEQAAKLQNRMVLVAVGAAGARPRIRRFLQGLGQEEGQDYLFAA
jgi:glycosyltransferase involved in cell wall biosynthesis